MTKSFPISHVPTVITDKTTMKTKSILVFFTAAVLAVVAVGCGTIESALLTTHQTVTPAVTNSVTVLSTNAAGEVTPIVTQIIKPAITNTVYEPSVIAQGGTELIGSLPLPGAKTAAILGGWLLTAFAGWKNKKLAVALVKGIDAGRQILQTTPEGQRLDAKFKDALIDHQETANVLNAAAKLVNQYTGDTVKPA